MNICRYLKLIIFTIFCCFQAGSNATSFKNALRQPKGIDAWKLVDEAIANSTKGYNDFAYDAATLNKVAHYLAPVPASLTQCNLWV